MTNVVQLATREQTPAEALAEAALEPLTGVIILAMRDDGCMYWKQTGLSNMHATWLLSRALHAHHTALEAASE